MQLRQQRRRIRSVRIPPTFSLAGVQLEDTCRHPCKHCMHFKAGALYTKLTFLHILNQEHKTSPGAPQVR